MHENSHKRKEKTPMDLKVGRKKLIFKSIFLFIINIKKNRWSSSPPPWKEKERERCKGGRQIGFSSKMITLIGFKL